MRRASRPALPALALAACTLLAACEPGADRGKPVDARLAAYIAGIKAVDNHAHPMRPIPPGQPPDTEYDALPLDGIPPFQLPWRLRLDNPEWAAAARTLYGVPAADTGKAYLDALGAARARVLRARGTGFPSWVLDQAGIAVMFANRVAVGPGLMPPRFRWVPFDDPLLFPLDTRGEASRTPDTRTLYPRETALLRRYLLALGMKAPPNTLEAYVQAVIGPTLRHQHDSGAVAVKFEAAYLRPLDFGPPDPAAARAVYARYVHGGVPTRAEYKTLEDYLFHEIARDAGALGMPVHLHVLYEFGGFYSPGGSEPLQLEQVADDSTLRGTDFVMLHGGWPFTNQTLALLGKPNMYADISMMTQFIEPSQLAAVLRDWLSQWPEKVLFGTDAFDGGTPQGWDQGALLASNSARRALGIALTGMMRDGEITRARAEQLARMVLRDNAVRLYRLKL
ncbi:MAG: amidohydrolase family protein [Gemmatimonadota bacterium]|nr:amidohydrolase family protein [Gemmatimonadota bacterium]